MQNARLHWEKSSVLAFLPAVVQSLFLPAVVYPSPPLGLNKPASCHLSTASESTSGSFAKNKKTSQIGEQLQMSKNAECIRLIRNVQHCTNL